MSISPSPTELRARLRWRREEIVATLEATDPAVHARSLAYLFAIGAALVLAFPLLPGEQLRHPELSVGAALAAVVTSGALLVAFESTPRWILTALPSLGTFLVTCVIAGSDTAAAPAAVFLYFWVILAGFSFSGLRIGLLHLVGVAVALAAGVLIADVPQGLLLWLMAVSSLTVTGVLLHLLRQRADTLILRLDEAAHSDSLTGLSNRRGFDARFEDEVYRAARMGQALALVVVDVDGFKEINDEYGHPAGDAALQRVAAVLRSNRRSDLCARLGGDEFAVLLPGTDQAGALELAVRFLEAMRRDQIEFDVRLSLGVASFPYDGTTTAALHSAADAALYEAKRRGGDQIVEAGAIDERRSGGCSSPPGSAG